MNREDAMRRFEALLDSALDGESAPEAIDPQILSGEIGEETAPADSYALWSAMTALTQEIKLQGRSFQDLNQTLAAQTGRIADDLRAVYAEREKALRREAEARARREVLHSLIDLRDRLTRGRESAAQAREREIARASKPKTGWRRFFEESAKPAEPETLIALIRGYELSIERLDQSLAEFGAREIRCLGEAFDPIRMNAIETAEDSSPPGSVLEVYRSGYEWNGEVFRTAQVKVCRAAESTNG